MTQDQWTRFWKTVATIATALSVLAMTLAGISISINSTQQAEINQLQTAAATNELQARGTANVPIAFAQGGKELVVGSGGTLTIDSGGTLDIVGTVSGGTFTSTLTDLIADTAAIGGGYGDTGCSVSAAGVLQCNGAATTDGALTAGSAVIGGGYGSTGCTLSAAGVLQCNGAATIDGATTSTGLLSANAGIAVDTSAFTVADTTGNTVVGGTLTTQSTNVGAAGDSVVYNVSKSVTASDIHAGATKVVDVPAGRTFRLVNATAVAYGATCTTSTSVVLTGSAAILTYTTANLTRSTILGMTSTGVALLADGASFAAQTAGTDIVASDAGGTTGGCTGVIFNVSYALD
jgi:hypothetical protein